MAASAAPETGPGLPPYGMREVLQKPFPERIRLLARQWAAQVNPNPGSILAMYWAKYLLLFAGMWAFFCTFNAGYPGFTSPGGWAFTADAFRKAVAWAIFYELCGFGCSSGPMNARFWPPIGGILHFLRPGTTKLPLLPGMPVLGGITRSWLDVALYAANQLLLLRLLVAPEVTPELLWPVCVLIPVLGVADKTLFLAARAEHYWVALCCLAFAYENDLWVAACKVVWGFIWFWAATSKLNSHFPSVIMVMMNNGPFFPRWLKKHLFTSFPDDLRPSRFAAFAAHFGTLTEYCIPVVLISSGGDPWIAVPGLILMTGFHGFIALNNPSGMPIEWNILMIYGGWFLFGFGVDPSASPLALEAMPLLAVFLFFMLVCVPTYGNFVPRNVSFLLAMRYYAGNWAYSIWLFRGESEKKLARLTKAAGTMREQLSKLLPNEEAVDAAMAGVPINRLLHQQGRVLQEAIPRAVDAIGNYAWIDGEIVAGLALGWNFGDGHLHFEQLLDAVQEQCGFEEGELRVVMVESQPLFGPTMEWRIVDAATGELERGATVMAKTSTWQPWPEAERADAFVRGAPERAPLGS
jgi:hypothetical protein